MTTTTATAATGVSAGSPTATASAITDTPAGEPDNRSITQRMQDKLSTARSARTATPAAAVSPAAASDTHGEITDASTGAVSDDGTKPADDKQQDGKKKADDVVPLAAFKKRIGEISEARDAAREEASQARHEAKRYAEAVRLLQEDNERLRAQRESGAAYDPRDEEIAALRLAEKAKQTAASLDDEFRKQVDEMKTAIAREAEREQLRAKLSNQIDEATKRYSLAERNAVAQLMTERRDITASEAAKLIHERELKRLEARGFVPRQQSTPAAPAPVGARAPGTGSSDTGLFPPTAAGMQRFLAARRGQ